MRLQSVDALRGLTVAAMLLVNNAGDWGHVYTWLEHASWHGCTPADIIFPFFLIIVGVSLFLAMDDKLQNGANQAKMMRTVLWRGCRILALGLALHFVAYLLIEGREFRLMGILQRIAICYVAAGFLMIYVCNAKWQWILIGAILLGYWALLLLGGSYDKHLNMVDQIDTRFLRFLAYSFDPTTQLAQEPEGLLSTIPAVASVLIGVRLGACLRNGNLKAIMLFAAFALLVAWCWSFALPFNKQLWTSSFALWTAGLAALGIAVANYAIDVRGLPAIGSSFGVNAIAAYAGSWFVACIMIALGWDKSIYQNVFVQLFSTITSPEFISFLYALTFTLLFGVLMWGLKRIGWRFSI